MIKTRGGGICSTGSELAIKSVILPPSMSNTGHVHERRGMVRNAPGHLDDADDGEEWEETFMTSVRDQPVSLHPEV